MRRRALRWASAAALAGAAVALAGCGAASSEGSASASDAGRGGPVRYAAPEPGGDYRLASTDFGFTDLMDPSGEYSSTGWNIDSNLLVRTLVSHPFTAGPKGNTFVPDLAEAVPEPVGLTYTFHLKPGIRFGPPVNRAITSRDIAYAFERIGTPSVAAQYAFQYEAIKGFTAFASGAAAGISGIRTPDARTISFTLTHPVGDFMSRLALPAAGPIPEEVAKCDTGAGDYGRHLIATGPYMYEGSEKLDISSCGALKPISGFDPASKLTLVRNPSYDPATDDPSIRQALPDRFLFTINTNRADIFERIAKGQLESSYDAPPAVVVRREAGSSAEGSRLRVNAADRLWYLSMNLTEPPFDDVHVRRAMNAVMDLDGLRRAWGGPLSGEIATDILPDSLTPGRLTSSEYHPFQPPPFTGDVEAAKAEMRLSRYDADKDGVCDAPTCSSVLFVTQSDAPWQTMTPIIRASAARIGLKMTERPAPASASFGLTSTPAKRIPMAANGGWIKDYADPGGFMILFDGRTIIPAGNNNWSLVGLTSAQAEKLGVPYPAGGVPSVDADIDRCSALAGDARQECWVTLDKRLTEDVVPWIPYLDASNVDLLGPAVTQYDYDQASGEQALAHVAVDPSLQED